MPLTAYIQNIMVSMAGQVATKAWSGEPWTGPTSDYQHVRAYIYRMAANGFFGPVLGEPMTGNMKIEKENLIINRFWMEAEIATEKLIQDHWVEVDALAQALLAEESMPGRDVVEVIKQASGNPEREWEKWRLESFSPYDPTIELKRLDESLFIGEEERKKKYEKLLSGEDDDDEAEDKPKAKKKKKATKAKAGANGKTEAGAKPKAKRKPAKKKTPTKAKAAKS